MLFLLVMFSSTVGAVTLTGSSSYAVPGTEFTLTCDVPEEAVFVHFYRRSDVTTSVGSIQVGDGQCYNAITIPPAPCTADVCSCDITSGGNLGTVFRWITQPQTGDQGSVWFCTRINKNLPNQTLDSDDYTLNVADGPGTSLALSPPDTTYTRREGDTLPDITCTADCRPDCTFVWTRQDNTNFTVSPALSLGQLDRTKDGTYRCTASNVAGESSITTDIIVRYGPGTTIALSPSDITYTRTEGDKFADITCTADCRPGCTFVWTRPDNINFTVSPVLSLGQLDRSEHGTYRCTARNVVGESIISTSVILLYGPSTVNLTAPTVTYTPTEGQAIPTITCSADCNPDCTYSWTKDGQSNITGSGLQLTNIQRGQTGVYRCTASNVHGSATTVNISVTVYYGPGTYIALSPPDTTYTRTEGDMLPNITCTAECRPDCNFVWTRPDNTNFTVSPVLSLGQLDRSEHGTYRCTARNVAGESSITTDIIVRYGPSTVNLNPSTVTYTSTEGQTIPTITCSADCFPACTYSWTKDGQSYTTGSGLHLTNIQRGQTGVYRCTASNVHGSAVTVDVSVTVYYDPGTSIAMSPPDTTYTRTEGDTVPDITCTADCRPDCTFVWTRPDNINFTVSPVLSLGQLDRSEHGTYRCTARNVVGESTITTSVTVQYGPGTSIALSPPDTNYTRIEGDRLPDIICTADCRPGCTFVWTRPDNTNFPVSPVLSLGQLDKSKHGIYRCTARNDVGESIISTSVDVLYGPGTSIALSPPDTNYTRIEGETLTDITCTADCRPDCTFFWTRPDNTNFTVSPVVSLGQLDRSEHGTYRCTARNVAGESTVTTSVVIWYPPSILGLAFQMGDGNLTEGSKISLICTVDSLPSSTVQWIYKSNGTVLERSLNVLESTYTLTNAGCLDTGLYTCSVRNSVSTTVVTSDIPINVLCKPREDHRISKPHKFGLATSENLTMAAMFLANPEPSFIWTFQNASTQNGSDLVNGSRHFTITNAFVGMNLSAASIGLRTFMQEDWYGTYDVTSSNSQGSGMIRFIVEPQGKPTPPVDVTVECPYHNKAILSWTSAFNGGSSQTFYIGKKRQQVDEYVIDRTTRRPDPGQHKTTNMTISDLTANTMYFFTIVAENKFGNSSFENLVSCITKASPVAKEAPLGAILGSSSGAAVVIVVVIVIIFITIKRKTSNHNKDDATEMIDGEVSAAGSTDGLKANILYESTDGLKANVLYETSEPLPGSSSEYAVVQKKQKSKPVSPNDVYAVVDKSKKENSKESSDLYAEVNKPKRKNANGGKGDKRLKGGKGKQKNGGLNKRVKEDVYENVEKIEDPIEHNNAKCNDGTSSDSNNEPFRKKNKDGLIYLDIEFKDEKQDGRNYVIHGIENRTDYADVDFTKRADPLPSDSE